MIEYPRNVMRPSSVQIDFACLKASSLRRYLIRHNKPIPMNASHDELVDCVTEHFGSTVAARSNVSTKNVDTENKKVEQAKNAVQKVAPPSEDEVQTIRRFMARAHAQRDRLEAELSPAPPVTTPTTKKRRRPATPTSTAKGKSASVTKKKTPVKRTASPKGKASKVAKTSKESSVTTKGSAKKATKAKKASTKSVLGESKKQNSLAQVEKSTIPSAKKKKKKPKTVETSPTVEPEPDKRERYCICKSTEAHGPMIACDNDKCSDIGNWFHISCLGLSENLPEVWYCPLCRGATSSVKSEHPKKKSGGSHTIVYADMIRAALAHLPKNQGTVKEICDIIEKRHGHELNWKSEKVRTSPVWKSSVRKTLLSNNRFCQDSLNKTIFRLKAVSAGDSA